MEAPTASCTPDYLNDRLLSLGVAALEPSDVAAAPTVANALLAVVDKARVAMEELDRVTGSLTACGSHNERLKAEGEALTDKLERLDKAKYKVEATLEKKEKQFAKERSELRAEVRSLSIQFDKVSHKGAYYEAKLKQAEQQYGQLRERVQKEVRGRSQALKRGKSAVELLRAEARPAGAAASDTDAAVAPHDRAVFQRVVDAYEEKVARLESDSAAGHANLVHLQRQLKAVTNNFNRLRRQYLARTPHAEVVPASPFAGGDELATYDTSDDVPTTPGTMAAAAAFQYGGDAGRTAVAGELDATMARLTQQLDQLEVAGAEAQREATVVAKLTATTTALRQAQALLRQQHAMLHAAVLASPTKPSPARPDPEDLWCDRKATQDVAKREAAVAADRRAVEDRMAQLQAERAALNMKWAAFEEARMNHVAGFSTCAPPGTPSIPPTATRTPAPAPSASKGIAASGRRSAVSSRRRKLLMSTGGGKDRLPLATRAGGNSNMTPLRMQASPATRNLLAAVLGDSPSIVWVDASPGL